MFKLKWLIGDKPMGRFREGEFRAWPMAFYHGQSHEIAAIIGCSVSYCAEVVRDKTHPPLTVRVADYSSKPWVWRKVKKTYPTLEEAQSGAMSCLLQNPHFIPARWRPVVPQLPPSITR